MTASQSNLSSSQYGYDFVVATTQASINSALRQYLANANEPTSYLCFLADTKGNPTVQISLADLMAKTGGINPFDIPDGTAYNDPRITTLTQNMFVAGIAIQVGLPPGVMPADLPPIVGLGSSASNVTFNLFCSEFSVIQNSPPSGFGGAGSWNVWSQPNGQAWYFSTKVDLLFSDLDNELNTPYFQNHPEQAKALIAQLENISGSAFSLQQLLFDLDNAAVETVPTIAGLDPGSDAAAVLTKAFTNLYFPAMKAYGEPVLSVHAVADTPDSASLRLTSLDLQSNAFVDGNGAPVSNPTPQQTEAMTLNYLCAADGDPLPGATNFTWNWVDPTQVGDISGVVSINRKTMAAWLYQQMLPSIQAACIEPTTSVDAHWYGKVQPSYSLTPNQMPQSVVYPDTGDIVLSVSYASNADANDQGGATYGELDIHSSYTFTASFSGNTITFVQHLVLWVKSTFDLTTASGNVVDLTLTDTYALSVDQNGQLQTTASSSKQDNSQDIDLSGIITWFVDMNAMLDELKGYASAVASYTITDLPAANVQSFVFPGADVFTYADVSFSDAGDLLTSITYAQAS